MRLIRPKRDSSIKCYCSCGIEMLKSLESGSVNLIVTDPPYRTTSRGSAGTSGGMFQKEINKKGQVFLHNNIVPNDYAGFMFNVLKDGGHCYIMCNHTNLQNMLNTFTEAGFHFVKSLVWDKKNKIMGTFYMSQFEYILFFRKGKGVKINNCSQGDILSVPNKKTKDDKGKNLHDTQKPVELMEILIANSSKEGELVLDPFAGLFTTAIACKRLNRKFIGCEIDKQYYDIGMKLLKE